MTTILNSTLGADQLVKLPAEYDPPRRYTLLKTLTSRISIKRWSRARIAGVAMNVLLLALWLWLFRSVYPYLGTIFSRQEFRTNQILLVGVLILITLKMRETKVRLRLSEGPQLYLPALLLVLISAVSYILVERLLDINTVSASLFGLASYGLLGLWLSPSRWRQGLPAGSAVDRYPADWGTYANLCGIPHADPVCDGGS